MTDDAPPAESPSPLKKKSVTLAGLCECIAVLALVCTWLGEFGRFGWMFDLMSHFRLQYAVICAVVLVIALLRRRTWLAVLALLSTLWNVQIIHAFHQTAAAPGDRGEKPLRVMSYNVLMENPNHVAVIDQVLKADADIVCLLEVDESWHPNLEPLRVKYPHRAEELSDGSFGIACYTRLPLKSLGVRRFSAWKLPTFILNLDHLGHPLTFVATHPIPPMSQQRAQEWRQQLTDVAALVTDLQGEVIVAGDFNATPWCEGMRLLREKSGLDFRSVDPVWPPTWGCRLPMMIPIDHVLVKGGLTIQKRTLGPEMGSDHRSLMVEIVR